MTTFIYILLEPNGSLDNLKSIRYVGKANNPKARLGRHLKECERRKLHNERWVYKIKKSGSKPKLEVIEEVDEKDWKERERYWIKYYKRLGCRLTNIANGGNGGESVSVASVHQMRKSSRYKKAIIQKDFDGNTIKEWQSIGNAAKALKLHNENISACCRGKQKTCGGFVWEFDKTKGEPELQPVILRLNDFYKDSKHLVQKDLTGNVIMEYKSARDASLALNINDSSIRSACRGKSKTYKGFIWEYALKEEKLAVKSVKRRSIRKNRDARNAFSFHKKPVIQKNLNNEQIKIWTSACVAAKELRLNDSGISLCCKGKAKTAGGFIWEYADKEENKMEHTIIKNV